MGGMGARIEALAVGTLTRSRVQNGISWHLPILWIFAFYSDLEISPSRYQEPLFLGLAVGVADLWSFSA